jgi:hypothetical protein
LLLKKNLILLFVLFFIMHQAVFSQSCLPEGITFSTQVQIDSFQVNYPNCAEIEGDVKIQGSSILNLNGLSVLTSIGGSLSIRYNDLLSNLTGLNSLTQIGSFLSIEYNDSLKNITALSTLTGIGTFIYIQGNAALTSLNGLEGITTIERLEIWNNNRLTSLTGLDNLISINGWLSVYHNDSLVNFSGLNQLDSIGGDLNITFNAGLTSMEGLEGLTYVGSSLQIGYNDNLNSLKGLDELTYIRLGLFVAHNPNLANISNLINLNTVKHAVWIENNDILESLSGLDSLNYSVFDSLYICNNPMLSECDIQSVCDYLSHFAYFTVINNNAAGCNSQAEVIAACEVGTEESSVVSRQSLVKIYPNPSATSITIILPLSSPEFQISIFNFSGQEMITRQASGSCIDIDISHLPGGVYFIRIVDEGSVLVGKFVKN